MKDNKKATQGRPLNFISNNLTLPRRPFPLKQDQYLQASALGRRIITKQAQRRVRPLLALARLPKHK